MADYQVYLLTGEEGASAGGHKAWLEHEGRPLLEKQIDFLIGRFEPSKIASTMQLAWDEKCKEISDRICWVPVNPNGSLLSAIQALLRTQPMRAWSFLYPVDCPLWEGKLFDKLIAEIPNAEGARCGALIPRHRGQEGRLRVLAAPLRDEILELDPNVDKFDDFLRRRKVHYAEVPFPCVIERFTGTF